MICGQCGNTLADDAKFCPACGAPAPVQPASPALAAVAPDTAGSLLNPDNRVTESDPAMADTAGSPGVPDSPDGSAAGSLGGATAGEPAAAGATRPSEPAVSPGAARSEAYIRPDYDPRQHSKPPVRPATNPGPNQYQPQPLPPPQPAAPASQHPSSTGMIIFSIINIVCCGLGVGTVLGTIALILAIVASGETTPSAALSHLHSARILNIVGIVLTGIQILLIIGLITMTAIFSVSSFRNF